MQSWQWCQNGQFSIFVKNLNNNQMSCGKTSEVLGFFSPPAIRSTTKVMFSVCLFTGGVPVVQNFATRCPTDLLGEEGVPVVQNFATRCPTDLLGGGSEFWMFRLSGVLGGGGPKKKFVQIFFFCVFGDDQAGGTGGTPLVVTKEDCLVVLVFLSAPLKLKLFYRYREEFDKTRWSCPWNSNQNYRVQV